MQWIKGWVFAGLIILVTACVANTETSLDTKTNQLEQSVCSSAWYEQVETHVMTGDGRGHGPDLGSLEWRSVVEFKLGIRGQAAVPAADSDDWCRYIDEHYIQIR